jgi:GNAT superfamily N-acetyltransferase
MEAVLLGWPPDGPKLELDYRRFSYAGKFVMTNTGKAVYLDAAETDRDGEREERPGEQTEADAGGYTDVLAAVAFNEDRTDPSTLWLRYVTVREDRRGQGLGPRLCTFVTRRAADQGYERARIAVNNPFAYEALYRAGFAFIGEETGLAELVLERPTTAVAEDRSAATYRAGLDRYRERDLSEAETAFLERRTGSDPPEPLDRVG